MKARVPRTVGTKAGQGKMRSNRKATPGRAKAQTKRQTATQRGRRA